jgi:hypothetical protein
MQQRNNLTAAMHKLGTEKTTNVYDLDEAFGATSRKEV